MAQALALGVLHGPAELLPISSSGHTTAIPWLLGWRYHELDPELRKSFEVALHAGAAAALLPALRAELRRGLPGSGSGELALATLSVAPAAVAGFALERPIERYLGGPATVAAGLLGGAVVMALADRAPQRRIHGEATAADAMCLGAAQALALIPGVSRSGATLSAARLRRFTRVDARRLSRQAGLPVIAGATALKLLRLGRRGPEPRGGKAFAAGAAASFASTLLSARVMRRVDGGRSLLPYAAYRIALASLIIRRLAR